MFLTGQVSHLTSIKLRISFTAEDQTDGKTPLNKQGINMAAAQAWQSISREHAKCLLMSKDHGFRTVTDCKGFATKYVI